ncbi:hypothetical protein [Streptomyces sp. VN1]|uniref:hypothetical protein n=1 Tax=Streptomyces sp. VN1 TaxID=1821625 RepID=UPI001413A4F7|nr:hypothetical protein [Streptomyces sp. VN1]QIP74713.1 hypothetical protein EZV63_36785 [Streptomyces sp. VN1]
MVSPDIRMTRILTTTSDLLDLLGEVERLSITCRPDGSVHIRGPIVPQEQPSTLVPAAAKALGVQFLTPNPPAIHKIHGVSNEVSVTVDAPPASPEAPPDPTRARTRSTTTAQMAAFVRGLVPWAQTVQWEQVLWLGMYDTGSNFDAALAVDRFRGLTELAVSALPNELHDGGVGPEGTALLPTGHTLRIVTAG